MHHKYQDLLWVALAALIGAITVIVKPPIPLVRVALTLPLVVLLPGYALLAAIFPRRLPRFTERWLMAVVLSLATTAAFGLLLNWTARGISEPSWLILLPGITWGACGVAAVRRGLRPMVMPPFRGDYRALYAPLFGALIIFAVIAIGLARVGESEQPHALYTALSAVRSTNGVNVGVLNDERATITYRAEVRLNGVVISEIAPFTLDAEETTQLQPSLPAVTSGKLEILLYRVDQPATPYRSIILWV